MNQQNRQFRGIWIPKEIWEDDELSVLEKIMLGEIDSLEDEERGCFASNKYFADFFKLSTGRISQIIKRLEEKKLIEISYIYDGKQIKERQIKITDRVFRKLNRGIKFSKEGYLENDEEINTYINNTNDININNTININYNVEIEEIINYLNKKIGTQFKSTTSNTIKLISARLKENYTIDDFKKVIDTKYSQWYDDKKMKNFLRPSTLFNSTNFENYLNEEKEKTVDEIWDEIRKEEEENNE